MQTQSVARAPNATALQGAAQAAQYLTFVLGGEVFAIGILTIKEIIEYNGVTDVPMMPPHLRGIINLRGSVVPVIDLSVRFGRSASPVTKRTCIVITEIQLGSERQDVGLVVDAVNAVVDIAESDIEPPPAFGAHIRADFIAGMGKIDGRFIILLSANQLLATEELDLLAGREQGTHS
ncbi:MAG: chemotaxis protein CheW [Steroidobacteraceae bacterium]